MSVILLRKKKVSAISYELPEGSEIYWYGIAADLDADWEIDIAAYGEFIMGAEEASNTPAGSNSHSHKYIASTGARAGHTHPWSISSIGAGGGSTSFSSVPNDYTAVPNHTHPGDSGNTGTAGGHSHALEDTDSEEVYPPYAQVYLIRALRDTACPIGGIVMWSNNAGDKPEGLRLCNGLNGTLDLREKFIRIASNDGEVGGQGGAETHKHGNQAVVQAGRHAHSGSGATGSTQTSRNASTYTAGGTAAAQHYHDITFITSYDSHHQHTLGDTLEATSIPPFIWIYYLMRTE